MPMDLFNIIKSLGCFIEISDFFTILLKLSDMGAALVLKMPNLQTKTKTEIVFILALISEGTSQTE